MKKIHPKADIGSTRLAHKYHRFIDKTSVGMAKSQMRRVERSAKVKK